MPHSFKGYENIDNQSDKTISSSSSYSNPVFEEPTEAKADSSSTLSSRLVNDDEESPYEEVAVNVPNTDDSQMLCVTFRSITFGILLTCFTSFVSQFFSYRTSPIDANLGIVVLLSYTLGEITTYVLPTKIFGFSINPGPMTVKEHGLVTIMATSCLYNQLILESITIQRLYYQFHLSHVVAIIYIFITQLVSISVASLSKRFLVWPSAMIWPKSIMGCSFIYTLVHGYDQGSTKSSRWTMSRAKFFWLMVLVQFAYFWFPGYIFPLLGAFSFICMIAPNNIVLSQITGDKGLGIGTLQFDWNAWVAFLDSPILVPFWTHLNIFFGFVLVIWIITPILYYSNVWNAEKMPIISNLVFDQDGYYYDPTKILGEHWRINRTAHHIYGDTLIPISTVISYSFTFAALTALITHTILYHGKSIQQCFRSKVSDAKNDIHTKLIAQYPDISDGWYYLLLVGSLLIGIFLFDSADLIPPYGLLVATSLMIICTIPYGIITATTSMSWTNTGACDLISSFVLFGKPVSFLVFRTFNYAAQSQILLILSNFKLAHYLKLPPRTVFLALLAASVFSGLTNYITAVYLLTHVKNICSPQNPLWKCLNAENTFTASIIFAVTGSFTTHRQYSFMLLGLPIGLCLPVLTWFLSRRFPTQTWVALINTPIILMATNSIPPAPASEYLSWFLVGFIFNFILYRYAHIWWEKYAYIFSAAMSCGVTIGGLLIFFILELQEISFPVWWGTGGPTGDGCPLSGANYSGIIPTSRFELK